MKRVKVTDCRTVPFPVKAVYAALDEFERYHDWWPRRLKVRMLDRRKERVGSRLEVRPMGGRSIVEITNVVLNVRIEGNYVEGVNLGTGVWTFEVDGEGTRVCYAIDLEPQGRIAKLLSKCIDFWRIHSGLMASVFGGLEARLRKQQHGETEA